MQRFLAFVAFAATFATATASLADPLPPKLCVAVVGDPDVAVQAAAAQFHTWSAARPDVRTVADPMALRALRGDASGGSAVADLVDARLSLRGTDGDGAVLDRISNRLGCTIVTELSARPVGLHVRAYDAVAHRFPSEFDVRNWAPAVVDEVLGRGHGASMARVAEAPAGPFGIAAGARVVIVPPGRAAETAANQPHDAGHASHPLLGGYGGWIIAGGAVLALLGGFLLIQSQGPGTPVINVHHRAGEQP